MITPVDGGQIKINAPSPVSTNGVLSPQYIRLNNLQSRPTEWVPGGRPIYKRLPSAGQTYQVSFEADGEIGYVYIPAGVTTTGPGTLEVLASDDYKEIVIQGGYIVWEYGKSDVLPVVLNIQDIDIAEGRYFLGYDLAYDDAVKLYQYEATDYYLYGEDLDITSSADSVLGWRYSASNAFTPEENLFWKNSDNFFPTYAQPTESYIRWVSEGTSAYSTVKVKLPQDVVVPPGVSATLASVTGSTVTPVASSTVQYDSGQGFFLLTVDTPTFQTGWQVSWSNSDGSPYLPIAVDSIEVSGIITLRSRQSNSVPKSALVMYRENAVPSGNTLCLLARVDINSTYEVTDILDTRSITTRDYTPVADWLTRPWDDNLIDLYTQVSDYSTTWMSPTVGMDFEYETLTLSGITVT